MFCGRQVEPWDIRYFLGVGGSTSGATTASPCGYGGNLTVLSEPDYVDTTLSLYMETGGGAGGTSPTQYAILDGIFGRHTYSVAGAGSPPSLQFILIGARLYAMADGTWRLAIDGAKWLVNGTVQWSTLSGTFDSPIALCPSSVPIFGTFPQINAVASTPQVPTFSPQGGFSPTFESFSADASAVGGYSLGPSGSGGVGIDSVSVTVNNHSSSTNNASNATNITEQSFKWAVPSYARDIVRMEPDTLTLARRSFMPAVLTATQNETDDYSGGLAPGVPYPVVTGGITYTTTLPERDPIEDIITDGPDLMEDALVDNFAPFYQVRRTQNIANPSGNVVHYNGSWIGDDTTVGHYPSGTLLEHSSWWFRAQNRIHPHWHYTEGFEGDTGEWSAGPGGDSDYWLPAAQQWMRHSVLDPTREGIDRRNFCVSSPLDQNGLTGVVQEAFGTGSYAWLGTRDFQVDRFADFPTSFLLDIDSSARWTFAGSGAIGDTSGTGSFSTAGVTITSGTTVDLALGSYLVKPFMALHRCDRLTIPACGAHVAKVEAFLIGVDGAAVKIGETTGAATTARIPRGTSTKSGGSWGHDMGGSAYTDTFAGAPSSDVSLSVAADPELSGAYPFLPFGSGERVRFVLTPASGYTGPMTMAWPTFVAAPIADAVGYADASPYRTVLFKDGPLVRYGTAQHYDPLRGLVNPPNADPAMDRRRELGDAFAWANLWGRGKAWDDSLATLGGADYEVGVEWTMVDHFWRDPFDQARVTHSFGAQGASGPILCRVNSYRAVPPLGMLPPRQRTKATDWRDTGPLGMRMYILAPSRRYGITVIRPTQEKPIGTDLYDHDDPTAPSGYTVRYNRPKTTGTEGYDFAQVSGGKTWAKVRDYRGDVWWEGVVALARFVASLWRGDGRAYRLVGSDTDTKLGSASIDALATWTEHPLSMIATDGFVVRGKGASLVVGLVVGTDLQIANVSDEGQAPISTMTDGNAKAATGISNNDGTCWVFRNDAGTVKATLRNVSDLSLVSGPVSTTLTGLSDSARIDASRVALKGNQPGILMLVTDGGVVTAYASKDGKTFTP